MKEEKDFTTREEIFAAYLEMKAAVEKLGRLLEKDVEEVKLKTLKLTSEIKEEEARKMLEKLKIPKSLSGYKFWKRAIVLCIEDENYINQMVKLYDVIAEEYNVRRNTVIKSMIIARNRFLDKSDEKLESWVEAITTQHGSISHSILLSLIVEEIKNSQNL